MADLSTLNIQITAGTSKADTAIDNLIVRLNSLNKALNQASINTTFISNINSLATGLSGLSNVSNQLNANNIRSFASALSALATSGARLSNLNLATLATGLRNLQSVHIGAEKFSGIRILSESLGTLTGERINKARTALPSLAQSLSSLSKIKLPNYNSQIVGLANALSKLGSASMVRAQNLSKITEGLAQLQGITIPDVNGFSQLALALSKFGNASMSRAIQQMPLLTTNFLQMMNTLSSAPAVSAQTVRLAEAMAQIGRAGRTTNVVMANMTHRTHTLRNAFSRLVPTMGRIRQHTMRLASLFGRLYASYFLVLRAFRILGRAISTSSALTEVENVVASVFGNVTEKLDEFANTSMYKFGLAELAAKQYASKFQAMGVTMGITSKQIADSTEFLSEKLKGTKRDLEDIDDSYSDLGNTMADMSINLTKLVSDYASFFNMNYDDVAKDFESIFTGMTRPMRTYGIDLTVATLKEWALKNGLDANIESMTQAQKTMLRYQYVMAQSGRVMNDYQITMNHWANVTRTIGQQFTKLGSIIGQGLINVFKPVLIRFRDFLNTFIDLTEKALNAIGKLLGWQIEIEEVGMSMDDGMEDYADSIGEAAGNAKKLNAQLRSIDELNNLTSGKDNGGGGDSGLGVLGGGGSSQATGSAIRFKKYESDINSWYDLGKRIADKIRDALNDIKWANVFQKARNFGKHLAEFLNGLIQPETFYAVGRTIANAINTAIEYAYSFGTNFDFKNLGEAIAEGVNGFFENFNFAKLAKTISIWVDGIINTIKTFVKRVKWNKVFGGLWDFFSNLSFETYAIIGLANITRITAAINALPAVFAGALTVLNNLQYGLVQFNLGMKEGVGFANAFNGGLSRATQGLQRTTRALIGVGSAVGEFALLSDGMKKIAMQSDDLGTAIAEMVSGIAVGAVGLTAIIGFPYGLIAAGVIGLAGAITGLLSGLYELEDEMSSASLANSIQKAFTSGDGVPLNQYIDSISTKIIGFSDGFDTIAEKSNSLQSAKKNVDDIVNRLELYIDKLNLSTEVTEEDIETLNGLFDELADAVTNKLQIAIETMYSAFGEGGLVTTYFDNTAEEIESAKNGIVKSGEELIAEIESVQKQLAETPYGTDEYWQLYDKYVELSGGVKEVSAAVLDLQLLVENNGLDWSEYFDENGLNAETIVNQMKTLSDAANKSYEALSSSIESLKNAAIEANDPEAYAFFEQGMPGALERMNESSAEEIKKFTDAVQSELIDGLDQIIEDSKKDWENKKWWEKLMYSGGQEQFTGQQVMEYVTGIVQPIGEELNTQFKELGVEAEDWLSEDMKNILQNGLQIDPDEVFNGIPDDYYSRFSGNMLQEIGRSLEDEINKLRPDLIEDGKDIVRGSLEGIESLPQEEYEEAMAGVVGNTIDAAETEFGIGSPAKEMNETGQYVILGIIEGFSQVDFASKMSDWWDNNVTPFFSMNKWNEIGQSAADGLLPQINNLCVAIADSFSTLANDVIWAWSDMVNAINDVLANLKVPTFEVNGKFDLTQSQVPKIDVKFYAQGGFPQTGSLFYAGESGAELLGSVGGKTTVASNGEITGISDTIRQTSSEEIVLLRQQNTLLQGILQKEFGISKGEIYRSVRSSDMEFQKMNGRSGFAY